MTEYPLPMTEWEWRTTEGWKELLTTKTLSDSLCLAASRNPKVAEALWDAAERGFSEAWVQLREDMPFPIDDAWPSYWQANRTEFEIKLSTWRAAAPDPGVTDARSS